MGHPVIGNVRKFLRTNSVTVRRFLLAPDSKTNHRSQRLSCAHSNDYKKGLCMR